MNKSDALPAGWRSVRLDVIDSTNDEALRRIAAGESHGFVVLAERQEQGRGRRNASWQSPVGNLFMSIVVEVPVDATPGQLAYVAGIAAAQACGCPDVRLKWPNDLILRDRKLGGILIEEGSRNRFYAVGLGINIATAPSNVGQPTASLSEAGTAPACEALATALCTDFAEWFARWATDGFAPVRDAWLSVGYGIGKPVVVRSASGSTMEGIFSGIDEDGALMLQRSNGAVLAVPAGTVFFDEAAISC